MDVKHGRLTTYFTGVAAKLCTAVEVSLESSHQHEFNGNQDLIKLFGEAGHEKHRYPTRFLYLSDDPEQRLSQDLEMTWYDARARHPTRTEHRLYFPGNEVMDRAEQGDLLLIAKHRSGSLLAVVANGSSSIAKQLHWLFGLPDLGEGSFGLKTENELDSSKLGLVASIVLEQLDVDADLSDVNYLDALLHNFGPAFPSTHLFSKFARESLRDIDPVNRPDDSLMAWMDHEEVLFSTLEKHLVGERLRRGFLNGEEPDVKEFLSFSLSVQNRRKSRAGLALENHLVALLTAQGLRFARGAITERGNKPDFMFPGYPEYHDPHFNTARLAILAAKTTAKDRWRQITKEADRVPVKHLLTLEAAISTQQTEQMRDSGVQLVIPSSIHGEYTADQRGWLWDVHSFIKHARAIQ